MAGAGDNSARALARQVAKRLDEIETARNELAVEMSEQYGLLRSAGVDVKAFRVVMSRRGSDREQVVDRDEKIQRYEEWLYGVPSKTGTKVATRARAREGAEDE